MKVVTRYILLVFAIIVLALCAAPKVGNAQLPSIMQPTAKLTGALCGMLNQSKTTGKLTVYETDLIPAYVGLPYGCVLRFSSHKKHIIIRSEFTLSEEPPHWGRGEALGWYIISPDRKAAVREHPVPSEVGQYIEYWTYGTHDPTGPHEMRFYIDGQLVHTYTFSIFEVPPPKGKYADL